jgi:POT family proton-dependent oligopeptide transporter
MLSTDNSKTVLSKALLIHLNKLMINSNKNNIFLKKVYLAYSLERASFNGIRAMLILYLSEKYNLSEENVHLIFVSMLSLILVIPLFLSYFLDKFHINKNILIIGLILSITGNLLLLKVNLQYLFIALSFIIYGTGLFRIKITTIIGELSGYDHNKKEANYLKLLLFGSIGSIIGIIFFSCIGEIYGWIYSPILSTLSLISAILILKTTNLNESYSLQEYQKLTIVSLIIILLVFIFISITNINLIQNSLLFFCIIGIIYIICISPNYQKMFLTIYLVLVNFIFSIIFIQSETSLVLFIEKHVDNKINFLNFIFSIPTTFFQSLVPIFIVIFVFITRILKNQSFNDIKNPLFKLNIGFIFLSFSMFILYYSSFSLKEPKQVHIYWIIISILTLSISELLISPTGMATINKLSLNKKSNIYMSLWLGSEGYALLSSVIITKMTIITYDNNLSLSLKNYCEKFYLFSLLGLTIPILTGISYLLYYLYSIKQSHDKY